MEGDKTNVDLSFLCLLLSSKQLIGEGDAVEVVADGGETFAYQSDGHVLLVHVQRTNKA